MIGVAVILLAIGALAVSAQDDEAPEFAIQAPLADRSLLLDAVAADGALVVVGERGHILISGDGGGSWQQAEVPARSTLTAVAFSGRDLGWAVGHDAVILRTSDGGTTWELVNWAPEDESPLLDVWFADADNGFAVGAYGSFYVTADGGETWSFEAISEDDFHLNHIAESATGRLYIAAEAGMIYRSDDGGESWIELPSPYEGSFFGTLPLDGDALLLFGLQGHLFRSEDAGESWNPVETGTSAMLTDGIRLADGTVLVTGLGGVLLASSDGGQTFEVLPQPDRRGISAVVEAGSGRLLLVGEFGAKTLPIEDVTP
jgi:photosystem II stability/assembly factor-like uncharacterized protein